MTLSDRRRARARANLARVCTHGLRVRVARAQKVIILRGERWRCHIAGKDIDRRIAAEISWSRTVDRSARTRPAREAFLKRFEKEVDPEGQLPPDERYRRAEHAKRAYMLRLAKRAVAARRGS